MEYTEQEWNGYRWLTFSFEDRQAMVLCPKTPDPQGRWLFKTEYFLAFPAFEEEMLARGFHVAWLENHSRWCLPEDIDVKPRFCDFLQKEFHLAEKCLPVGMSCGGMHAVYFAAKYPQYVAALYLDAPVINLLSCPCGVGTATDEMYPEFLQHTGMTVSQLINYRNHPQDHIEELLAHRIPIFLVCGDADHVVPYCENGKIVSDMYRQHGGILEEVLKPGVDHHPHGLEDNAPLIQFALQYYK